MFSGNIFTKEQGAKFLHLPERNRREADCEITKHGALMQEHSIWILRVDRFMEEGFRLGKHNVSKVNSSCSSRPSNLRA